MAESRIDWPGIAEAAVTALLGDRNRKLSRGRKWRYGNKGSLKIDLDEAFWYDFEANEGGTLLKLVSRVVGVDWKGAYRWLEEQGLKEPWRPDPARGRANRTVRHGAGRKRGGSGGRGGGSAGGRPRADSGSDPGEAVRDGEDERRRIALARAVWSATGPVAGSPVAGYLAWRRTWPERAIGPDWPMVPGAVAWIDQAGLQAARARLQGAVRDLCDRFLFSFPGDAAGAMVAAYLPAGTGFVNPAIPRESRPVAVYLEALTAAGRYPASGRWRKHFGVKSRAAFAIPGNPEGREIAIVEGECDGLAVALMARARLKGLGDVAEVRVVGGSGFQADRAADTQERPVVLLPDGPGKDGKAMAAAKATGCATRLRASGRKAHTRIRHAGDEDSDSADDLKALVIMRAWQFEEGHVDAEQAEREAWRALLDLPEKPAGS